jgi:hypothetical protein
MLLYRAPSSGNSAAWESASIALSAKTNLPSPSFSCEDYRPFSPPGANPLDRRESWRGSAVMRNGGDKVVIKLNSNGHYIYFSVRDERDNGTIVDFVQFRKRLSLGEVRKELRSPVKLRFFSSYPQSPNWSKCGKTALPCISIRTMPANRSD